MKIEKLTLIQLELNARNYAISLIPAIIECIKKFDGKKSSKRLDTALKQIDKNLAFRTEYNSFRIMLYIENRSIRVDDGSYSYIEERAIDIMFDSIKSGYGDGIEQNGVIIAETAITKLKEQQEYLQKSIAETEKALRELDALTEEAKELNKQIENFNRKVPYLIESYFKITINTR